MSFIKTTAIVLAGGQGKRMNSKVCKQYLMIEEKPVLYYAIKAFQESFVDEIILVVAKGEIPYCQKEFVEKYEFNKVTCIVEGGKERYHSVFSGIQAIRECDFLFIHDGARPFLTQDIISRAYDCVKEYYACVVGMPVKDTIKIVDENQCAKDTPDRNTLWMIQTPQVFSFSIIKKAYEQLILAEQDLQLKITDDAMVVETYTDYKIKLVEGSYSNLKITTPEDLEVASSLVKSGNFEGYEKKQIKCKKVVDTACYFC